MEVNTKVLTAKKRCLPFLLCLLVGAALTLRAPGSRGLADAITTSLPVAKEAKKSIGQLPSGSVPFSWTNYDTIFLYHTRKAGGSTLRVWLEKVARKHNLAFVVEEGTILSQQNPVFRDRTLYITALRDPVERVVSLYWYEGRWPLTQENKTNENAVDFRDWLIESENRLPPARRLYECSSECYCRWFGSDNINNVTVNIEAAMERLQHFDIVLNTERLKEGSYAAHVAKLLNAEDIVMTRRNTGVHKPENSHDSTYLISAKDMGYAYKINKHDMSLFRRIFAKRKELPQGPADAVAKK